ncbi:MAG: hypothetical protein U5K54_03850 [Cytophagales bacterium]|nr:hypothetical protein [Cytophagales bacterium]
MPKTYGSGNAPSTAWFIESLKDAIKQGIMMVNISQMSGRHCDGQGKYETSKSLADIGVISGEDMTMEAAVTKLMILLGEHGIEGARKLINQSLAGEVG